MVKSLPILHVKIALVLPSLMGIVNGLQRFVMQSHLVLAQRRRHTRLFEALNPDAVLSHLEMKVLVGIFFPEKASLISIKDMLW